MEGKAFVNPALPSINHFSPFVFFRSFCLFSFVTSLSSLSLVNLFFHYYLYSFFSCFLTLLRRRINVRNVSFQLLNKVYLLHTFYNCFLRNTYAVHTSEILVFTLRLPFCCDLH